jgi:hypothetical protein
MRHDELRAKARYADDTWSKLVRVHTNLATQLGNDSDDHSHLDWRDLLGAFSIDRKPPRQNAIAPKATRLTTTYTTVISVAIPVCTPLRVSRD